MKWFMILRTPTEDENGGTCLRTFSPRLVIPAHGNPGSFSAPIGLDTRFRGYDGTLRLLLVFGLFVL